LGMKVIGLTGGIGSGKSTVARFLRELGAEVIDTDTVGHEAFNPESETWRQVVAAFGRGIVKPGGEIDRPKLGEVVFADKAALARLDGIVHPFIYRAVKARLDRYKERGVRVVVLEVPILVELEPIKPALADEVDEVWVTVAPEVAVIKRLKAKGLPEDQARARISTQLPASRRTPRANVVIDTDCTLEELRERVKTLWKERALDIKTS
jgi:dephospho-CoA kinase